MARMVQCKQKYLLDIDLPYLLAIFFFKMAHPVELNPYKHAKCVQIYGWKCLICSFEVKDQVGLELQHIADGIVYIDGIDGTMWVCCQKYKKTYHFACVCPHQPQPTEWSFVCSFLECKQQVGKGRSTQVGNFQVGNHSKCSGKAKEGKATPPKVER